MRLFPLSESAITIELGNEIAYSLNARAIAISKHFDDQPFPGMVEAVPAYASVTLFYDPIIVKRAFPSNRTAFEAVAEIAKNVVESVSSTRTAAHRLVEIPIIISEEDSPDLPVVAKYAGLAPNDVIDIFLFRTYRVYMLGFLPGFAYMGEVDDRIAAPRLSTPRTRVPKGSIGIAGKQTGIYPLDSPGGWNIIGRTDRIMFDAADGSPSILKPGDEVKFTRMD